uniref:E3 ubiquitin-protein ligase APD1-4 N-terminal domain-containing protein n=1 Tax=Oryza meridionalis TaxID=40149 RepID=A0A0E0BVV5_9ORYZ
MLGYYHGSPELVVVGSGCSRLVETNSFIVQDIKARTEGGSPENGLVLYGMPVAPPLGVPAAWSEARRAVVPANSHMEWVYFLNRGSEIEVAYSVRSGTESSHPICMIIVRGKESFLQWAENPSANETTLSWHLVHGNGTIKQTINLSSEYYIALGNFNNQDVPGLNSDGHYVKLSYGPRWIVYIIGLVLLAVALLILYDILNTLFGPGPGGGDARASLLSSSSAAAASKEEDDASLGSSYDSVSHDGDGEDDDDVEERGGSGGEGLHLCVGGRGGRELPVVPEETEESEEDLLRLSCPRAQAWGFSEPVEWRREEKNIMDAHRGARTHDHKVKSLALYRLS